MHALGMAAGVACVVAGVVIVWGSEVGTTVRALGLVLAVVGAVGFVLSLVTARMK